MDNSVHVLEHKEITCHRVVTELNKRVGDMTAIYVVTVENGVPTVYTCGQLNDLCLAAMTIMTYAQNQLFE